MRSIRYRMDHSSRRRHELMEATLPRPRLTAADWEIATLDLIAESGVPGVAVETLAKRMGVTKGSFYWHFPNREALLEAALKRWAEHDLDDVIAKVSHIANPAERLRSLFRIASREMRLTRIYSALLRAVDHPLVKQVVEATSARRIQFLTQVFNEVGFRGELAQYRAQLAYSAYIGFMQLALQIHVPRMSTEQFEAYVEHVIDVLVPDPPAQPSQ